VLPILVFIGLEITAQSFAATPKRHYAAVAIACLPALAVLALNLCGEIFSSQVVTEAGITVADLGASFEEKFSTLTMLSSGFILTSLFWAWALAATIDRKLGAAAIVFFVCGLFTLFGLMHSPLDGNRLFVPFGPESWQGMVLDAEARPKVFEFAAAYAAVGALMLIWRRLVSADWLQQDPDSTHDSQLENDPHAA
jgi:AGZA family xanthine/uracil permease-like MFS transporter